MICKHGRNEIPEGQTGRYFICKFGDRSGRSCRWARWDYGQEKFVSTTHPSGAICPDMCLVEEEVIGEFVIEDKKVVIATKKPSKKTTVQNPSVKKTTDKKPCGCG